MLRVTSSVDEHGLDAQGRNRSGVPGSQDSEEKKEQEVSHKRTEQRRVLNEGSLLRTPVRPISEQNLLALRLGSHELIHRSVGDKMERLLSSRSRVDIERSSKAIAEETSLFEGEFESERKEMVKVLRETRNVRCERGTNKSHVELLGKSR